MDKLRIIQTSAHFQIREHGGFEHYLCKGLSELGHRVHLITSDRVARRYSRGRHSLGVGEQAVGGYKIFRFRTLFELIPTEKSAIPILDPSIKDFLSNLDFDIVHAHEIYQPISLQSFRAAIKKRKPYGFSQHRNFYPRNVQGQLLKMFYRSVGKTIVNSCDFVCATSSSAVSFLNDFGVKRRVAFLPNCLDIRKFRQGINLDLKERMGLHGYKVVLFVGRLYKDKGVKYLIKAFKAIRDRYSGVKLIIAGNGPERERLELQAAKYDLRKDVIFLGHYPHHKIPELYNVCDVFVLPSLIEPFGMVLIEAMACGKPVIGSKVGGILDIIEDGKNGFLTKAGDSTQMAKQIEVLLLSEEMCRKFGRRSREIVEISFSYEMVAKKAAKIYKKALERKEA